MSQRELPVSVDPYRLAEQDTRIEGRLAVAGMDRLVPLLVEAGDSEVAVDLHFHRDQENRHCLSGRLAVGLRVQCQRCLEPMRAWVESAFELAVAADADRARQLPATLEPLELVNGEADVQRLIEDEIILAMPAFPCHEAAECPATPLLEALRDEPAGKEAGPPDKEADPIDAEEPDQKPFAGLADLIRQRGSDDGETN